MPAGSAELEIGKLPAALLQELLDQAPPPPSELLLAPRIGEDACAIAIDAGALIVATDPVTLTGSEVGAFAVWVNANDVAVTGARPRWFLASVLLPPGSSEVELRRLFAGLHEALAPIGAVLVGGHTEVTPAVTRPVVVGQMLGLCEPERVVRTGGVREGDAVLQVGLAPIEGSAVLAVEAASRLETLPAKLIGRARNASREPGISVVEPALRAAELGAHALHDPTEGGLSAGLYELAEASGLALQVDADAVLWFEPGLAICEALGADPWGVLASGALLAAFAADRVAVASAALRAAGFSVSEIAQARAGSGVARHDGRPFPRYERDELSRILGQSGSPTGGA